MAYTKTNWTNTIPINTTNLNKIENGIADNATDIGTLSDLNTSSKDNLVNAINEISTSLGNIIENGSIENGEWIKFANGFMLTVHQIEQTLSRTNAWGNMYETNEQANLGEYPVEFKNTPYIFLTLFGQNAIFEAVNNPTNKNAGYVYLLAPTSNANTTYTIQVLAIGRWK